MTILIRAPALPSVLINGLGAQRRQGRAKVERIHSLAFLLSMQSCAEILVVESFLQAGLRGRVPVPLVKRSVLHSSLVQIKGGYPDV
jgi:hypothetical protein